MRRTQLFALFVLALAASVGGGFLGAHLHARASPSAAQAAAEAPAPPDAPVEEVTRQVLQELRKFRGHAARAESRDESERENVLELPIVEVEDPHAFVAEFAANQVAFLAKYEGKRARLARVYVVEVVAGDRHDRYAAEVRVSFEPYALLFDLRCYVNQDQLPVAAKLEANQKIEVVGRPTKHVHPVLQDCVLRLLDD